MNDFPSRVTYKCHVSFGDYDDDGKLHRIEFSLLRISWWYRVIWLAMKSIFSIRLSVFIPSSSIQYSLFASSFVRKWNCTSQSVNVWHSFSSKIKSTWPEIAVKNLIKFHIMPVPLYLSFLIKFHKSEWRRVLNIFTTKSIFSNRRKNPDVIQMRCVCAVGRIKSLSCIWKLQQTTLFSFFDFKLCI